MADFSQARAKVKQGNGFRTKAVYEQVFGGEMKFRVEDYGEIFGRRGSSIPILDLPAVDEAEGLIGGEFDYAEVFGGFDGMDFALSYEDLFLQAKKVESSFSSEEDEEVEAWTPAETGSPSEGSSVEPACSEDSQAFKNGESHLAYDDAKQFNMSYHKISQIGTEHGVSGTTHIAHLNAVPAFTFVVNEDVPLKKEKSCRSPSQVADDDVSTTNYIGGVMEGKHLQQTTPEESASEVTEKKHLQKTKSDELVCGTVSRNSGTVLSSGGVMDDYFFQKSTGKPSSDTLTRTSRSDFKPQSNHSENGTYNGVEFITVSEINLRTQPCHVPPPSRPPPKLTIKQRESKIWAASNLKASVSYAHDGATSDGSPPYFDVEIDASSSAAASAAAMKEAMEKAQARLKSAKESMERKKDGLQNRKKLGLKEDMKSNERRLGESFYRVKEDRSHEHLEREESCKEQKQRVTGIAEVVPDFEAKASGVSASHDSVDKKHVKVYGSTPRNLKDGTGEWKAEELFYELVKTDNFQTLVEPPEKNKSGRGSEPTFEVCQHEQNEKTSTKLSFQQEENDGEFLAAADEFQLEEVAKNENAVKERELEREKGLKEAHELEESNKKLREAFEWEQHEKRLREAREFEEHENRLRRDHERQEQEKKLREACEQEKHEKKLREAREKEEFEKKLREACEQEKHEKKLREAHEKEEYEKKLKEAHEMEEQEKKQKEIRQQMENEITRKEAHQREENEKNQKEESEKQETEKRLNESCEREAYEKNLNEVKVAEENKMREKQLYEENERRKEANEREKKRLEEVYVKQQLGACEGEENEKRLRELREQEEKEKVHEEDLKKEENEKKLKEGELEETEKTERRVREGCEREENNERQQEVSLKREECEKVSEETHLCKQEEEWREEEDNDSKATRDTCQQEENHTKAEELCRHEENEKMITAKHPPKQNGNDKFKATSEKGESDRLTEACISQSSPEHETCEIEQEVPLEAKFDTNEKNLGEFEEAVRQENEKRKKADQVIFDVEDNENTDKAAQGMSQQVENEKKIEAAHGVSGLEDRKSKLNMSNGFKTSQNVGRKEKRLNDTLNREDREQEARLLREREQEKERYRKNEEDRERIREREKDRIAVERATREARERAYAEAHERAERAAVERATAEVRQRALAEARERLEKASAEAREKSLAERASVEARIRAERAAVERATLEARERAVEKSRAASEARERVERSFSEKLSTTSRDNALRQSASFSDLRDSQFQSSNSFSGPQRYPNSSSSIAFATEKSQGAEVESAQRCKARLERHQRTIERAAKALHEKNMRDFLALREQAEKNRLAETLDADVKRWSSGKEGNLRALLSTLQYILGPESGWQPVPLTDVITAVAAKKAYRKATLCVHPDKLQQRGASIQQKYICEKVFDLLKEAWNKFNSEER